MNIPPLSISSLGVPCSATTPSDRTTILSVPATVLILCAMTSTVLSLMSLERAVCIAVTFSTSGLVVASSSGILGASYKNALAMEIRCLSPPDRALPFSPMPVSDLFGSFSANSSQFASRAACKTSSSVASLRPSRMFSMIVLLNKVTSWNTIE